MSKQTSEGKSSAFSLHKLVMPVAGRLWLVGLIVAMVTAVAVYGMSFLTIENDLQNMMADENVEKIAFRDAEEKYGDSIGMVLAFDAPDGIYRADFLERLEKFSQEVLDLNIRLLARKLRADAPLDENQSVLLASWLQSLISDPTFAPDEFGDMLEDPEEAAENMADFMPSFLQVDDSEELAASTAAILAKTAKDNPARLQKLLDTANETTDERHKEKSRWVDQIISLTQTDSAWPQFKSLDGPLKLLQDWGIPGGDGAKILLEIALERGVNSPAELDRLLKDKQGLVQAGVPQQTQAAFAKVLNARRAGELIEAIRSAPKQIRVGNMISLEQETEPGSRQLYELELRLKAWSFFDGTLRSPDDHATLMMIRTVPNITKVSREPLLNMVRELLKKDFGDTGYRVYQAGATVVNDEVSSRMTTDIRRLLPIVVVVVAVFLFLSLRSIAGVVYPLATVLLSIIWCLGFMGFVGLPISIVATALPVLLVAVGSAYGIHFIHHFRMFRSHGRTAREAVVASIDVTGRGVVMAGLTTVAGFASLAANSIVALSDFGIAVAVGVFFALVISLYVVTALLLKFGAGKNIPAAPDENEHGVGGIFTLFSEFCMKRAWWVVLLFVAALTISGLGLTKLYTELNNMNFFRPESEIRQADSFINARFAGTVGLRTIFTTNEENGALDPVLLEVMEKLAKKIPADNPEVGKASSAVDLIKKMNQAFHYNDSAYYRLPQIKDLEGEQTRQALMGQYAFYVDKFPQKQRKSFVDTTKKTAVLNIQVNTSASTVSTRICNYIDQQLSGPLGEPLREKGIKFRTTGIGKLYHEASNMLVSGQMWSVALSLLIVLVLVSLTMRSVGYGLLAILPLSITIVVDFGLMGWAGIALDAATAITACVAVGIGVDYSIHYLNRYREGRARGLGHHEAALETAQGSGQAIVINAVAVGAGFLVMLFSSFVPLFNVGILMAFTMILTALGSLTLIPALLTIANYKSTKNENNEPKPDQGVAA